MEPEDPLVAPLVPPVAPPEPEVAPPTLPEVLPELMFAPVLVLEPAAEPVVPVPPMPGFWLGMLMFWPRLLGRVRWALPGVTVVFALLPEAVPMLELELTAPEVLERGETPEKPGGRPPTLALFPALLPEPTPLVPVLAVPVPAAPRLGLAPGLVLPRLPVVLVPEVFPVVLELAGPVFRPFCIPWAPRPWKTGLSLLRKLALRVCCDSWSTN